MVPTAPHWPAWVGLMVTTYFDLVLGPFWVPRVPKRAHFGPNVPNFHGPIFVGYFSNMYRLNTRAGVLPRSASSHFSPYRTTQFEKTIKKRQKGPVLAIKGPFGDLGGPRRAPGDQIWSQRPPIGPSGLDSCSPHTLTGYRAPSGPPGAQKGPIFIYYCIFLYHTAGEYFKITHQVNFLPGEYFYITHQVKLGNVRKKTFIFRDVKYQQLGTSFKSFAHFQS